MSPSVKTNQSIDKPSSIECRDRRVHLNQLIVLFSAMITVSVPCRFIKKVILIHTPDGIYATTYFPKTWRSILHLLGARYKPKHGAIKVRNIPWVNTALWS